MLYGQYFIDDLKDRAAMLRRVMLVFVSVVLFASTAIGQDIPKATLVTEFGRQPCGFDLMQLDLFLHELERNPDDQAVIVIFPEQPDRDSNIKARIIMSRFETAQQEHRLKLFIADPQPDFLVRMWRVPTGTGAPVSNVTEWVRPKRDLSKAFIFGYEDENMICPTFVPRKLAEVIMENPGSRVHFVVREGDQFSGYSAKGFEEEWLEILVDRARIPRNRIRVFHAKSDYNLTHGEFWFVPAKN